MPRTLPTIDADSHKCENPILFRDFVEPPFRQRIDFVRDRYGEQRIRLVDADPLTGKPTYERLLLQPDGLGKGTYRPYHREGTIGGLFNRVRIAHMDREGIDHQVIYGSITLAFNSLRDADLSVALCRGYNDYIAQDCERWRDRLHPVGVLPLADPAAACDELQRCVEELGMVAVTVPPHLPVPHPEAPDRFPAFRAPKHLSHPDFEALLALAERLDVTLGLHGAPGVQLASGTADLLDSFTLVHVFANRNLQQMALAKLVFDGTLERHPRLRLGLLEAGCGWLPDFVWSLHEHWEKRVVGLDPTLEPRPAEFLRELARETKGFDAIRRAKNLLGMLFETSEPRVTSAELERFRTEHPDAIRDPVEYLAQDRIFLTAEPDDPGPAQLAAAWGPLGERIACFALDYGHWDASVEGCVRAVVENPRFSPRLVDRLLTWNALELYGPRLRARVGLPAIPAMNREARAFGVSP